MTLGELIKALERMDQEKVVAYGFGAGASWRGDYSQVAFKPERGVSIRSMLDHARAILGTTMHGYKGGEYVAHEHVDVHIADWGDYPGDAIGPALLAYWSGAGAAVYDEY